MVDYSKYHVALLYCEDNSGTILAPVYEALKNRGFEAYPNLEHGCNIIFSTISLELSSVILIPHGVGDLDVCGKIKSHFVSGKYFELWAKILLREKYGKVEENQVKVTGWPKLDILFQPEKKSLFNDIKEKYKLNVLPYGKTVIYTPTSTTGNTNSFDPTIDILIEAVNKIGVNLLIKPHQGGDIVRQGISVWGQWIKVEQTKKKIENMPNIRWIPSNENIVYFYPFSDVLVSDVSSCLREFMVMDKPSIQIDSLSFIGYKPTRIFEGVIHAPLTKLHYNLELALNAPDLNREEREVWKEFIFDKADGHASDRIVDAMIEICGW